MSSYATLIELEQLKEIHLEVTELLQKIVEANISRELKSVIYYSLELIQDAIVKVRFNGTEGLQEAVEKNLGSMMRNRKKLEEEEGDQSVIERYFEVVMKAETLVSLATGVQALAPPVIALLTSGK